MIKKSGICAGVSILAAMLLCLGSVSASETPTPEQVAAAGVQASDLEKIKLAPGGWWNDAPEFNGRLYTSLGPPPVEVFVMTHVFGLPDNDPSGVATALSLLWRCLGNQSQVRPERRIRQTKFREFGQRAERGRAEPLYAAAGRQQQ